MNGLTALRLLNEAGYEAYFVGGCVRDMLLAGETGMHSCRAGGSTVTEDIDITTNALPEEVKRVFAGMRVIDTGLKHGTVTVLLPENESGDESLYHTVEITTYRVESGYSDGRHPDSVSFTSSLEEDLARRDFTVNAVAMDAGGSIIDPFGGREDMKRRIIRTVGDPDERFKEDALRIMRALRFASVLGFEIDCGTEEALFRNSHMLSKISVERIFSEFKKLVAGENAGQVIRKYVDVLGAVMPELSAMKGFQQHNEYHRYDVLEHCIRAMEAVRTAEGNHMYMKMAALLHDVGKPLTYSPDDTGRGHFYGHAAKGMEVAAEIMDRFKADKALSERVCLLVKYHDLIFQKDERLLKKWMNRFTPEVLFELLEIKRADNLATGNMSDELKEKFDGIEAMMRNILAQQQCFSLGDLAVKGSDIMALGVEEGPKVGELLDRLLEEVIEGRVENDRAQLMDELIKFQRL